MHPLISSDDMKASLLSPVEPRPPSRFITRFHYLHYVALATLSVFLISRLFETFRNQHWHGGQHERRNILARCQSFNVLPGSAFQARSESDRFVPGTRATLLRNGKVSTRGSDLRVFRAARGSEYLRLVSARSGPARLMEQKALFPSVNQALRRLTCFSSDLWGRVAR